VHNNVLRWLATFAFLCPVLLQAQDRKPVTHGDIWLMPRVGAAAVSPDGRLAVFSVVEPSYDKDKQASDLWLVATDGKSAPRRLTQTRTPEAGQTWSADSKRIAFTAKRDGDEADQIYVLDLNGGGEAQRVTQISTGARLPKFSPDGTRIAFTSNVHPDARDDAQMRKLAEEEKARKYNVRAYTSFPIRNWDQWLAANRQPHALVQVLGEPQARDLFAGTAFIKQPGFAGRTTQGGAELDLAWTPDGQALVFAATRNAHRTAYDFTNAELFEIAVTGGEPRRLTGSEALEGSVNWSEPKFSPDGRSLYALREGRSNRVFNPTSP
jgi:Tol biopolymer transport system component